MKTTYVLLKINPTAQIDKELFHMLENVDDGGHKILEHKMPNNEDIEKIGDPIIYWP